MKTIMGDKKMDETQNQRPKVVAEIGCNHKGEMSIAYDLIEAAKNSGAEVAKFQKRANTELLTEEQYNAPHPNPNNSYGKTYGEHREFLEFDLSQHLLLKNRCDDVGIEYSTSVWDVTSAEELITIDPNFLKVPSACNTHFEMLEVLRDQYRGEIHLSLGMTDLKEEDQIIEFFSENSQSHRLTLYSCTSGYPVPANDICLLEITRLKDKYSNKVNAIGFSGHHTDTAIDLASVPLGVDWIERHFTLDKGWKGTDHSASLEPSGLKRLIQDLDLVSAALTYKEAEILEIEIPQRDKLKYRK